MRCGDFQLQSDSTNTLITTRLNQLPLVANAASLDFQVQAVTGYYAVTNKTGGPAYFPSAQDWHTEITFNASETSDWSSTQTTTIHSDPASASATSTSTPTSSPAVTASLSESASALNYGNSINFTVSAEGGMPPYTYAWYMDNQIAQTSASQYFSTNTQAVGSHHVYVQVTDANNSSATTLTVEFYVLPVSSTSPSSSLSPSNSPTQQPTLEPTLTASPPPSVGVLYPSNLPIIIGTIIITIVAISISILIYFKKYHGKK
jgi:hypothetical protein